jgi:hypothetical protein
VLLAAQHLRVEHHARRRHAGKSDRVQRKQEALSPHCKNQLTCFGTPGAAIYSGDVTCRSGGRSLACFGTGSKKIVRVHRVVISIVCFSFLFLNSRDTGVPGHVLHGPLLSAICTAVCNARFFNSICMSFEFEFEFEFEEPAVVGEW